MSDDTDNETAPKGGELAREADEKVGYGHPPVKNRFRPGQSGNPRGRPKGTRNLGTVIGAALNERVAVVENGRRRNITKLEAAVKQLVNRAASGEARATQLLFALIAANEAKPPTGRTDDLNQADLIVMAELARRFGGGT